MARLASAAFAVAVACMLGGCVTTQQKNARTLLLNARMLASESRVQVRHQNPAVQVAGVTLLSGQGGAAFVVRLRNLTGRPLTDLPISVGTMTASGRRYYNGRAGSGYYAAHVPALPAGAAVTWVFADRRALRGRPFATVGTARHPATTRAATLPRLDATPISESRPDSVRVAVTNHSGIPQYDIQVYTVAVKQGRSVAAAAATLPRLDGGTTATVALTLIGHSAGAAIHCYAMPTIFA